MMLHGLATFTNQEITDEELNGESMAATGDHDPHRPSASGVINPRQKKRDITIKQFDYIYKNKIDIKLEEKGKFKFTDMNLLLNAYEYWRYENINKQTF